MNGTKTVVLPVKIRDEVDMICPPSKLGLICPKIALGLG